MPDRTVEVSRQVAAPPAAVYDLVGDVTRMGDWSPETSSCRWLGGATGPAVGARFAGSNRRGPLVWTTVCTVTAAERGRAFAFVVHLLGLPVAQWSYPFEAVDGGCRVVEAWSDRRSSVIRLGSVPVMGIHDRAAHNRRGMEVTWPPSPPSPPPRRTRRADPPAVSPAAPGGTPRGRAGPAPEPRRAP